MYEWYWNLEGLKTLEKEQVFWGEWKWGVNFRSVGVIQIQMLDEQFVVRAWIFKDMRLKCVGQLQNSGHGSHVGEWKFLKIEYSGKRTQDRTPRHSILSLLNRERRELKEDQELVSRHVGISETKWNIGVSVTKARAKERDCMKSQWSLVECCWNI